MQKYPNGYKATTKNPNSGKASETNLPCNEGISQIHQSSDLLIHEAEHDNQAFHLYASSALDYGIYPTSPDKWSDEQWERMNILFDEFLELKEAFDLKEEFRKLYWSKRDKEEDKDKLPAPEERNALKETVRENLHVWYDHVKKSKSPGMKTFMRTIKEREEDLLNYYETFVTNASAESLNSGIKGFRAELHGISNLPFFFYRVCKIYG